MGSACLSTRNNPGIFVKRDYDAYRQECERIAPDLTRIVCDTLHPQSVVDVGCGLGIYLREFGRLGLEVRGYEFSPDAFTHSVVGPGVVVYHDLRRALLSHKKYDLCICAQVAEHLEPEYSDHIMSLVTHLSDTVYWSAADLGSAGKHHVNCQRPVYWREKFGARGYYWDSLTTQKIMDAIKEACPFVWRGVHIWADCMIYRKKGEE